MPRIGIVIIVRGATVGVSIVGMEVAGEQIRGADRIVRVGCVWSELCIVVVSVHPRSSFRSGQVRRDEA
jgi:hypothetical protein